MISFYVSLICGIFSVVSVVRLPTFIQSNNALYRHIFEFFCGDSFLYTLTDAYLCPSGIMMVHEDRPNPLEDYVFLFFSVLKRYG